MKIIISDIGYYHPSNANWNYNIFFVENPQGESMKVKSTFGADYRLKKALEDLGHEVKSRDISGNAKLSYSQIKNLPDIDADMANIIERLTRQVTHFEGEKTND